MSGRRTCASAVAVALVAAAAAHAAGDPLQVEPGTQLAGGAWTRLSQATSSKPRAVAFTRGFLATPHAMAFEITASRRQPVHVFWSVYCEGFANDSIFNQQGTVTMRPPFTGYPQLSPSPSKCFLTIRATPTTAAAVRAITFGY